MTTSTVTTSTATTFTVTTFTMTTIAVLALTAPTVSDAEPAVEPSSEHAATASVVKRIDEDPREEETTPVEAPIERRPQAPVLAEPREAHGMSVRPEGPSPLLWVPRALLFVPRLAIEIVDAPIRGAVYASDRFMLAERAELIFFDDAKTYGAYPTGVFKEGFGFSLGARAVHRDLLGDRERLSISALYGGRYDQKYKLGIDSGQRFGERVSLEVSGTVDLRPRERFFGIGNGELVSTESLDGPIDPTVDDTAVSSRYRERVYSGELELELDIGAGFGLVASSLVERRDFDRSSELHDDNGLADVFDTRFVPGYEEVLTSSYNELELHFDTRRPDSHYTSAAMPSDGWFVAARVGYNHGLGGGPERDYLRYAADIQRYVDLYEGTRTLSFRLLAAQIDADIDDIPFVFLPNLGGDTLLRGYQSERFRDRGLALASAEYKWELAPKYLAAYMFTDVGRVQQTLTDPTLEDLRVGFGAGVQLHTLETFLLRAHVASSIDGGLFLNIDFDPVANARIRE